MAKPQLAHPNLRRHPLNPSHPSSDQRLYEQVVDIIEQARRHVARTVNTAMLQAYWLIGERIVEVEQAGRHRAGYSEEILSRLSIRLQERYERGFSPTNLRNMRKFFLSYPSAITHCTERNCKKQQTVSAIFGNSQEPSLRQTRGWESGFPTNLSWSHYLLLIRIQDARARAFYEIEAASNNWSVRELERQIGSLLFERLASAGVPDRSEKLASRGQTVESPRDLLKDPLVLEFLDLSERPTWTEHDLERAIIAQLQEFMLELGKGFSFVARQKRISIDSDHFYVDLVFYNRLLRAFVLVDLKLGKLTHQDLGQMQMYVHYFDRFERQEWERSTVGIVLCSDKNDAMVRITLPEDNRQIHAPTYQLYLPSEAQLRRKLIEERARFERNRSEPQRPGD